MGAIKLNIAAGFFWRQKIFDYIRSFMRGSSIEDILDHDLAKDFYMMRR
jgi:hypothetical protein